MIWFFDHRPIRSTIEFRNTRKVFKPAWRIRQFRVACISQDRFQRYEEYLNIFEGYAESTQADVENLAYIQRHNIKLISANF